MNSLITVRNVGGEDEYYEARHEDYLDVRGYGESRELAIYSLGRLAYAIDRGLLKYVP